MQINKICIRVWNNFKHGFQTRPCFQLVFHWVSKLIHLTIIRCSGWVRAAWIINEFEKVSWKYIEQHSTLNSYFWLLWSLWGRCSSLMDCALISLVGDPALAGKPALVRALAGDIVLCSCMGEDTLPRHSPSASLPPRCTNEYWKNLILGETLHWTSILSREGVEILLATSCYRYQNKIWLMGNLACMQALPWLLYVPLTCSVLGSTTVRINCAFVHNKQEQHSRTEQ